jgi:hypothetical protein
MWCQRFAATAPRFPDGDQARAAFAEALSIKSVNAAWLILTKRCMMLGSDRH